MYLLTYLIGTAEITMKWMATGCAPYLSIWGDRSIARRSIA